MSTKPTKVPRWADTGTRVEPSEAKKDSGWITSEKPPASYFNWLDGVTGDWLRWLGERMSDGSAPARDVTLSALEGAASEGGDLRLLGGDGLAGDGGYVQARGGNSDTAVGGYVELLGGDGDTAGGPAYVRGGVSQTGPGGLVEVRGGAGGTSGTGGNVAVKGGAGGSTGSAAGALFASSGDAVAGSVAGAAANFRGGHSFGTNQAGGDGVFSSGASTGSAGSHARLRAAVAGATGTTQRTPEDFIDADGVANEIKLLKDFTGVAGATAKGRMRTALLNVPAPALELRSISSGDMVNGFGSGLRFFIEDNAGVPNLAGALLTYRDGSDAQSGVALHGASGGSESSSGVFVERTGYVGVGDIATLAGAVLPAEFTVRGNVYPLTNNVYDQGDTSYRWRRIHASQGRFLENFQAPGSNLEVLARCGQNAICSRGRVSAAGALIGDHFNVLSASRTGNGSYVIDFDQPLSTDSTVVATCQTARCFAEATFVSTTQISILTRRDDNNLTDAIFSFAVIGGPSVLP